MSPGASPENQSHGNIGEPRLLLSISYSIPPGFITNIFNYLGMSSVSDIPKSGIDIGVFGERQVAHLTLPRVG